MAEAFVALGIAANIAQFIDIAKGLIRDGKEIYHSLHGARDGHHALRLVIEDIKDLNDELKPAKSKSNLSIDEKAIRRLAEECEPLAEQLLNILKDLQVPDDTRFRVLETVRQTFRSASKKKKIEELEKPIASLDERLRARASRMLEE